MARRSSWNIAVVVTTAAIVAVLVGIAAGGSLPRRAARPRPRPAAPAAAATEAPVSSPESEEELVRETMARTTQERAAYDRVLADAVRGDPQGEELLAFYRTHAWFSFYESGVPGGVISVEGSPARLRDPLAFEVTIATPEEREANGRDSHALWEWVGTDRQLFMPPAADHVGVWAGAIMAHELSHAHDALAGGEPPGLPWEDPRFLDGELRAYELTFRLLNRAVDGRLQGETDAIVAQFGAVAGADGILMLNDEPLAALDALFPFAETTAEISARRSGYRIYLNMRLAEMRGNSVDWRRYMVLSIMRMNEG